MGGGDSHGSHGYRKLSARYIYKSHFSNPQMSRKTPVLVQELGWESCGRTEMTILSLHFKFLCCACWPTGTRQLSHQWFYLQVQLKGDGHLFLTQPEIRSLTMKIRMVQGGTQWLKILFREDLSSASSTHIGCLTNVELQLQGYLAFVDTCTHGPTRTYRCTQN